MHTVKRIKRQAIDWEKIFANMLYFGYKRLVSKINKELLSSTIRNKPIL